MLIDDIKELYHITAIANVAAIVKGGIFSHNIVQKDKIKAVRIDEQGVQDRREKKIPGTEKMLHDYANLYFDAHNPMLSKRRNLNDSICVLRIEKTVFSVNGVIITDKNASRDCWFKTIKEGLPLLSKIEVLAPYWNDLDLIVRKRLAGIKCAEVLIPEAVSPKYIVGAFVANSTAKAEFEKVSSLPVEINTDIFFY